MQHGFTPVYYTDSGYKLNYQASDAESIYWNKAADGYRLPTESEWEIASIGGKWQTPTLYSGSNFPNDVDWYADHERTIHIFYPAGTAALRRPGFPSIVSAVF